MSEEKKKFEVKIGYWYSNKEYVGKNGKVYKNTNYRVLQFILKNPVIKEDKEGNKIVYFAPTNKDLINFLLKIKNLEDGYTRSFWKTVFAISTMYFLEHGTPEQELIDMILKIYDMFREREKPPYHFVEAANGNKKGDKNENR